MEFPLSTDYFTGWDDHRVGDLILSIIDILDVNGVETGHELTKEGRQKVIALDDCDFLGTVSIDDIVVCTYELVVGSHRIKVKDLEPEIGFDETSEEEDLN